VTRLRKMMLEELQRRNYSAITTRNYVRVVTKFAKYFGKSPDKLGSSELRTYQAHLLTECKLTPGTVVNRVAALRFFFVKTLKRHQFRDFLPYPQDRRRLPTGLSREEVERLINAAGTLFRRTLLMTLYATGMRRSELARLKVNDIDSQRMIIRVVQGKGGKDRDSSARRARGSDAEGRQAANQPDRPRRWLCSPEPLGHAHEEAPRDVTEPSNPFAGVIPSARQQEAALRGGRTVGSPRKSNGAAH
jgi:integrase